MFRRYTLTLIQHTLYLVLVEGWWGQALVDTVAPYQQPAPATLREWVRTFCQSAAHWLLAWLQHAWITLTPLAALEDVAPPAPLRAIAAPQRRTAFRYGWQALRLAEAYYAACRSQQPTLVFQASTVLAFVAAAVGATRRPPRLLWPQGAARAPTGAAQPL